MIVIRHRYVCILELLEYILSNCTGISINGNSVLHGCTQDDIQNLVTVKLQLDIIYIQLESIEYMAYS